MTWIAVGVGGASAVIGGVQMAKGYYDQKKNKRPEYQIPEEVKQNLNQAQQQALQGLPEEQKQQYLSNLQRGSAQALASAGSRKGGLAGIAGLADSQNQAYGNLLGMDAAARQANQQTLSAQRQNMADYKDKAWGINKENPYYERTAQNQAMIGAGMQNISGGLQMAGGGVAGMKPKAKAPESTDTGGEVNPYGNTNVGTYNNPNTKGMFVQPGNQYGNNMGQWNAPDTTNMFKQTNLNPYYPQ